MKKKSLLGIILLIFVLCGCTKTIDDADSFNLETDYQDSYTTNFAGHRFVQADENGLYIFKNDYIYYYNVEKNVMLPLCNKANCLHDKEGDENRKEECNAYASTKDVYGEVSNNSSKIQYYDGDIYFARANYLYRISKDGSKKDLIFTETENLPINDWLIHRGVFYYETAPYYYGEDNTTQIYSKAVIKAVEISRNMKSKNAAVIYEGDEKGNLIGFSNMQAYGDYLFWLAIANPQDYTFETTEQWEQDVRQNIALYNIKEKKIYELMVPTEMPETTDINAVYFLPDKILVRLYDDTKDEQCEMPIYSMDYDMQNLQIWLEGVPQDYEIYAYDDKVLMEDQWIQYFEGNTQSCNYYVYDSNANLICQYECPTYGTFYNSGISPEGKQILLEESESDCNVYLLDVNEMIEEQKSVAEPRNIGRIEFQQ